MKIERKSEKKKIVRKIRKNWDLYLLIIPIIAYFIIFKYIPMYGLQIAFKDFIAVDGIFNSPWVGLEHFERFFQSFYFERLLSNTLLIGLYELAVGFPIPIILALMINEVKNKYFKSFIQTITYAPHFLSVVVVVGILYLFLSPQTGIINQLIVILGGEPIYFMAEPAWFKTIFVFSGVWQNMGWSSIIYLAALSAIDPQLQEAAKIDGASRLQRIWHINLPSIKPTIIIMLILQCGSILGVGFEKVFLMQNSLNMSASDVISTHIYRTGILGADYSYSTAIGLFESFVNLIILLLVNYTARKVNKVSLW
ncbi:sugar ABC transporter permease [Bacillus circulans]|uniref:Sugar ABC transporter permease n=1 Tax=Niallia circulans TaxID=1397 RepID=A0AA91TQ16_NIACI|nr:ABC transporter permease subunit [Niallia circulans]NRG29353.1 sugar ABC transporter permease [Niallia circulans]PAD81701.1 sugar ABC transporter permease [Niallia circulans]